MPLKKDGHVHTPFCPHGSTDELELYIKQAIKEGFNCLTFTEHAPLPKGFKDPTPQEDSAMKLEELGDYFESILLLKERYQTSITINVGLEIDYIRDYEKETTNFLNEYGKYLDDSILSVHFLKIKDQYYCMDFDDKTFNEMIVETGSLKVLHETYYNEVLHSINSDLGNYKPKRIGHITLVNKFQKLFPVTFSNEKWILDILTLIKEKNMEIDYNVAGLRKEYCGEIYPNDEIAKIAIKQEIPLIYGSDAHSARDVGKNYKYFEQLSNSK
ncbi:histidinol-phosphatase HisJ [Metabacillus sp. B2-18]|uniref:histidinol-phosphatase HisJ n=1 Tax=Metabacillus sp. B2-18 TaxID=2897333 RepID=UPI001E5E640A|nr:histidinol-phosphatase HisJ [Metabacillus sp. B2-18]UGB29816.1 histidinol-phosphatase HisJ [Metabacillus sp. B2-18]